jgi:hypothetical protein
MQRLVSGYALCVQKALDAVDVLDPLVGQHLALASDAAAILLFGLRAMAGVG